MVINSTDYFENSSDFLPRGYKFLGLDSFGCFVWSKNTKLHQIIVRASFSPDKGFYHIERYVKILNSRLSKM